MCIFLMKGSHTCVVTSVSTGFKFVLEQSSYRMCVHYLRHICTALTGISVAVCS